MEEKTPEQIPQKPKLQTGGVGLSLKKLKQKKEEILQQKLNEQGQNLPVDKFTQTDFEAVWYRYLELLRKNHEQNLLSILSIDKKPKVKEAKIYLRLPSQALKRELERIKEKTLNFLRSKLNNYDIDFVIEVEEKLKEELVYTKQDKFKKLLSKYPDLLVLKDKFKLDI